MYITDRAYTESQIREMEIKILAALGIELGRPSPLHFLRRNSKAGNVDALMHTLAKSTIELTLVEYKMYLTEQQVSFYPFFLLLWFACMR